MNHNVPQHQNLDNNKSILDGLKRYQIVNVRIIEDAAKQVYAVFTKPNDGSVVLESLNLQDVEKKLTTQTDKDLISGYDLCKLISDALVTSFSGLGADL